MSLKNILKCENMKSIKIKFSMVDITRPFFTINYSPSLASDTYKELAILSAENAELFLLEHDVKYSKAIDTMFLELNFYLYELENNNPIAYLIYHCSTLSNIYSQIRFNYIEKITCQNIFHYLRLKAKSLNIHNNNFVTDLERQYAQLTIDHMFVEAFQNKKAYNVSEFNEKFITFFDLIFIHLPKVDGFNLPDSPPSFIHFSKILSSMEIRTFCNILNYFKRVKLIKPSEINGFISMFHINKKEQLLVFP